MAQARQAAARGSSILVARGLQAALIKRHTSIPVVEIVISAQEMALLIQRARQLILKERPTIAVAGNQNMFCDMSRFEDIFHINLPAFPCSGRWGSGRKRPGKPPSPERIF